MDTCEIISISDSESEASSIVLVKLPDNEKEKAVDTSVRRESSISQNNEDVEVVTLSSVSQRSTERCPVTWTDSAKKSNLHLLNPDTYYSPSPRSKVTHWLSENACRYAGRPSLDQQSIFTERQLSELIGSPMDGLSSFSTNKSSILVRQDYKKSESSKPVLEDCVSSNVRLLKSLEADGNRIICLGSGRSNRTSEMLNKFVIVGEHVVCNRTISVDNTDLVQQPNNMVAIENSQQALESEQSDVDVEETTTSTPLSVKSLVKNMSNVCSMQAISNDDSSLKSEVRCGVKPFTNIPLSPETQKKIELCEYLKLMNMNPSDASAIEMQQNRRSTRVKHLALMSEKRELERKLNSEVQEGEKKKSLKMSDTDSRYSSENNKGSKTPSKKGTMLTASTASSNASKTPSRNVSPSQKPAEDSRTKVKSFDRRNSVKTPSKSLQVPEVSTTSISKFRQYPIQPATTNQETLPTTEHDFSYAKVLFRKSEGDGKTHHKSNSSNSSSKSEIITKKSFEQLHMNVESLKSLRNMRSQSIHSSRGSTSSKASVEDGLNFSLVKSVANFPNTLCDFEETLKDNLRTEIATYVTRLISEEMSEQGSVITRNSDRMKNKKVKLNRENAKGEALGKRKAKASSGAPKMKIAKLNGILRKRKSKQKRVVKQKQNSTGRPNTRLSKKIQQHASPKHINRLRSRGRLKQIKIKTILLKEKKKKVTKPKAKHKKTLELRLLQEKDYRSAELIQHGNESSSNITKELNSPLVRQVEVIDKTEKLSPTKCAPIKVKKLLPEAEVWKKYFTSEHRKAYIESIKYLDDGDSTPKTPNSIKRGTTPKTPNSVKKDSDKEIPPEIVVKKRKSAEEALSVQDEESQGFETTEVSLCKLAKMDDGCENARSSVTPMLDAAVCVSDQSSIDKQRPSSEDLEVDQLMSCKLVKDQATQKNCESPNTRNGTLRTDTTDSALADHSRCTSSSNPVSTNSSSLQTVESIRESTPSALPQSRVEESPALNHSAGPSQRETPNSTKESDTVLYQNDDTSSRFSIGQPEVVNISQIQPITCTYVHLPSNGTEVKSLHHCLTQPKTKLRDKSRPNSPTSRQNWEETFNADKSRSDRKVSQSHTIYLSNTNGAVMNAYYLDFNLIIVQELLVSFWDQSPLGNVLGAHDMWIPKGNTGRMVLGNGCVQKESPDVAMSVDSTVAYIELWTKEHKSDKRERPVADIFVAIYLRLSRSSPDKKVLQLENIHGYATDVQYIVLRNSRSIIVSWNVVAEGISSTSVHCYHLSPDYQMVTSITKMQSVDHYVSSLHNIEDCDTLIVGCGDCKITLWNLEHGYIVATIDLIEIQPQPRTVWAKCDRGFLFTLHHFNDGVLQLIAINSFDSTWKRLQTYKPEADYDNLLGVCMENGLLVAFYDNGVSCWSARTGAPVLEDTCEESGVFLPFGKHVVVVLNNQVHVRHALEYLLTTCPVEDS